MVALDRRRFITPVGRARPPYAVNVLARGPAGPVRLLRRTRRSAPAARTSAARPGTPGRPACRSSMARSRRSSARSSRRSAPATTTCSSAAWTRSSSTARASTPLLYFRRRYLRIEQGAESPVEGKPEGSSADDPGERARHRLRRPRRGAAARPAPRRDVARARRTSPPSSRCCPRRSSSTCPMPAATAGRAGTRPRASATTGSSTTSPAFVDGARARLVPPARLLDGRDDRAPVRGALAPERLRTLVVVGITTQREPRASVGRRLMDPARISSATTRVRGDRWRAGTTPGRARAPGSGCCRRSRRTSRPSRCSRPRELRRIDCPAMVVVRRPRPVRAGRSTRRASRGSCPAGGCSSRRTAATRSWLAGRACSTRRSPASTARPRPRRTRAPLDVARPGPTSEPATSL